MKPNRLAHTESAELDTPRISDTEFARMIRFWESQGHEPLDAITLISLNNGGEQRWFPAIMDYDQTLTRDDCLYVTGDPNGYATREQAMACIGRCWDQVADP